MAVSKANIDGSLNCTTTSGYAVLARDTGLILPIVPHKRRRATETPVLNMCVVLRLFRFLHFGSVGTNRRIDPVPRLTAVFTRGGWPLTRIWVRALPHSLHAFHGPLPSATNFDDGFSIPATKTARWSSFNPRRHHPSLNSRQGHLRDSPGSSCIRFC